MFDQKLDNAHTGKEGTGSNSICMLCHCKRILARRNLGQWSITKTIEEIIDLAFKRIENPDGLTEKQLKEITNGIKGMPFMSDFGRGFEAPHADLSWLRFILGITICLKGNLLEWVETREVKNALKEVRKELDDYVHVKTGLQPALQLPGNYAREILDEKNQDLLPEFPSEEQTEEKKALKEVNQQYCELRRVYWAKAS